RCAAGARSIAADMMHAPGAGWLGAAADGLTNAPVGGRRSVAAGSGPLLTAGTAAAERRPPAPVASGMRRLLARLRRGRWGTSLLLCGGLFTVYSLNAREIGAGDTVPAPLLPVAILRGDGLALNRFAAMWPNDLPWYVVDKQGQIISRYPLAPGIFAVPFTAPQMLVRDLLSTHWDQGGLLLFNTLVMGKTSASLIAALTGVAIFQLLRALGLERVALLTALFAGLGSTLYAVAAQALWQHGPAALSLTLALILLLPERIGR